MNIGGETGGGGDLARWGKSSPPHILFVMRSCDSSQFAKHSFKDFLCSEIMNDVIRATVAAHNKTPGRMEWRVLVVDTLSMKMVSACTKMHELSAEGITSKKANDKHVEVDKILFSCRDCDQEERTHASYGGKITVRDKLNLCFSIKLK